jgi:membrane fusion protein (multidrug efflux system)
MSKRKKIIIAVSGVMILILLVAIVDHIRFVKTDNAQLEAHTVMLAAKVPGFISEVKVSEGQKVKKGDLLVTIDQRDYNNTLKQIQGELSGIEARMKDAQASYHRISELYKSGAVSSQQFDTSTATFSEVKAKYEGMAAQVAQAKLNLENTEIRAPSDGFIAKKSVEEGQLASPGIPLIGFVSSGERWVTANFKETEVDSVRVGAEANVTVDAISGKNFKGKVAAISPATGSSFTLLPPDNATGNFTKVVQRVPVKIDLENLNEDDVEKLRAGLSVIVKVHKF